MSKKYSTILICFVLLMSTLLIPAGNAIKHLYRSRVRGTFDYTFDLLFDPIVADGKTFLFAEEWETWVGDFEGEGHAYFIVMLYDSGLMEVVLISTIDGVVDGKEGTLVLRLVGNKPADGGWFGTWVILSGTEDLADIKGQGIWWGPGYGSQEEPPTHPSPDIYYSGTIRETS